MIRILIFTHPGSPDPGVKKAPDPDPQHWFYQAQKIWQLQLLGHWGLSSGW